MTSCWASCGEPSRAASSSTRLADAARLVDETCSLIDRCIDRCRNGFSRPPRPVVGGAPRRFGVGQVAPVLGMRVDPVGGDRLERRQRRRGAALAGGLDEEAADVGRSWVRTRRRLSPPPFSRANGADESPEPRGRPIRTIQPLPPRHSLPDPHERHHRTALRQRPHPQRLHGRAGARSAAAPAVRPDEMGADLGQQLAGADRLRHLGRGQGKAARLRLARQLREDAGSAPVTAIIGMDMAFYEKLPQLFPHVDAKAWFVGKKEYRRHDGVSQLEPAGRLPHHRRARPRPRLRADERLRQRQARRRVLRRHRRSSPTSSATSAMAIRRSCSTRSPRLSFEEACRIV